jgi:hypothetical protein
MKIRDIIKIIQKIIKKLFPSLVVITEKKSLVIKIINQSNKNSTTSY